MFRWCLMGELWLDECPTAVVMASAWCRWRTAAPPDRRRWMVREVVRSDLLQFGVLRWCCCGVMAMDVWPPLWVFCTERWEVKLDSPAKLQNGGTRKRVKFSGLMSQLEPASKTLFLLCHRNEIIVSTPRASQIASYRP